MPRVNILIDRLFQTVSVLIFSFLLLFFFNTYYYYFFLIHILLVRLHSNRREKNINEDNPQMNACGPQKMLIHQYNSTIDWVLKFVTLFFLIFFFLVSHTCTPECISFPCQNFAICLLVHSSCASKPNNEN